MPLVLGALTWRFAPGKGHPPLRGSIQNERISKRLRSSQHNKPFSIFDMPLIQTDLGKFKRKKAYTPEYKDFLDRPRSKPKSKPKQRANTNKEEHAKAREMDVENSTDTVLLISPMSEDHLTQMLVCHETLDDSAYDPDVPVSNLHRSDNALSLTIRSGDSFGVVRFRTRRPGVRAFLGRSHSKEPASNVTPSVPDATGIPDAPLTPNALKRSEPSVRRISNSPPRTESRKRRVADAKPPIASAPKKPRAQKANKRSFDNRLAVAAALSSNSEDASRFELCDLPCDVVDNAVLQGGPNPLDDVMRSPSIHRSMNECDPLQEVDLTLQLLGDEFDQFL